MARRRKIITASLILALGLALAWPFRKSPGDLEKSCEPAETQSEILRADNGDPIAALAAPVAGIPVAPEQVAARTASTNDSESSSPSFDLANHPAIANELNPPAAEAEPASAEPPALPADSRPVYSTVERTPANWPKELLHVVANGDTLEKLAERYLNDAGRALEIFDQNRDLLANPHLLPIGVELRVPVDPDRIID